MKRTLLFLLPLFLSHHATMHPMKKFLQSAHRWRFLPENAIRITFPSRTQSAAKKNVSGPFIRNPELDEEALRNGEEQEGYEFECKLTPGWLIASYMALFGDFKIGATILGGICVFEAWPRKVRKQNTPHVRLEKSYHALSSAYNLVIELDDEWAQAQREDKDKAHDHQKAHARMIKALDIIALTSVAHSYNTGLARQPEKIATITQIIALAAKIKKENWNIVNQKEKTE